MEILDGHKYQYGVIAGNYGDYKKGRSGTYLGLMQDITDKIRAQLGLAVRLKNHSSPYTTTELYPSMSSGTYTGGAHGTIVGIMRSPAMLYYGGGLEMQLGGIGPDWLYLPPRLRYRFRGVGGFANGPIILQANLMRG